MAQRAARLDIQTFSSDLQGRAVWTPFIVRVGGFSFGLFMLISMALPFLSDAFRWGSGELAFETDRDGNWEIYLLDIATGIERNLTRRPAQDLSPSWSPD